MKHKQNTDAGNPLKRPTDHSPNSHHLQSDGNIIWKLQLPFVASDTFALMQVWMSASDLENDSSRRCSRRRRRTCEKPLTPWECGSLLPAREDAAVNMLGTKHSCGRLLIGELASWGSKHMRQLRSDSCCVAGGANSGASPVFHHCLSPQTSARRFYPRQRRTRQCLRDAIIGRSCHHRWKFREGLVKVFFPTWSNNIPESLHLVPGTNSDAKLPEIIVASY